MHLRIFVFLISLALTKVNCYSNVPVQYHIQTDKGIDRYFRFQTYNGQYRKEKRLEDGTVIGAYGWVDPTGLLRLYDYIADKQGYRIVRTRTKKVVPVSQTSPVVRDQNTLSIEKPIVSVLPNKSKLNAQLNTVSQVNSQKTNEASSSYPKLKPVLVNSNKKPVASSKRRRNKYKSVRQRLKESQSDTESQNVVTNLPEVIVKQPEKAPVVLAKPSRRRKPTRVRVPLPSGEQQVRQTSNQNPTFLTDDVPPDLGYDSPGGKVTIDFDIGVQYRKEKMFPGGVVVGEHGYVDPMGILRKTYYRSDSEGKKEYKKSFWVGTRSPNS